MNNRPQPFTTEAPSSQRNSEELYGVAAPRNNGGEVGMMKQDALTETVTGCAIEVHRALGTGTAGILLSTMPGP